MDTRKKFVICAIITLLFDMEAYVIAYDTLVTSLPSIQMLFISRYLFMIPFYVIQIYMLRYAIELQSRLLYFFPFYWGMELYRLIFRNLTWFTQTGEDSNILNFLYKHVTAVFWTADYALTYENVYSYNSDFPAFSVLLLVEDIVKLIISIVMIAISCKYLLLNHKIPKKETSDGHGVNSILKLLIGDSESNYQTTKRKFIISGCVILIMNLVGIVLASGWWIFSYGSMLFFRYVIMVSYYVFQILFLYYAIKMGRRWIYFFPFYWAVEIWRLLYRAIMVNRIDWRRPFFNFMYKQITMILWGADWFPSLHLFVIDYHGMHRILFGEDVIKFLISVIMVAVAARYAFLQYRKGK